jgi:hypothetical protein
MQSVSLRGVVKVPIEPFLTDPLFLLRVLLGMQVALKDLSILQPQFEMDRGSPPVLGKTLPNRTAVMGLALNLVHTQLTQPGILFMIYVVFHIFRWRSFPIAGTDPGVVGGADSIEKPLPRGG